VLAGSVASAGVLTAGEAFDARDFLRSLSPEHLSIDLGDPEPSLGARAANVAPRCVEHRPRTQGIQS
jgi:hypothetical protein